MKIDLPDASVVNAVMVQWCASDARLGALLDRYRDAPQALRHYGLIHWREGSLTDATKAFAAAAALAPADPRIWSDLAGVFSAGGHAVEAGAALETSIELDSGVADVWLRLGALRSSHRDFIGARVALERALTLDPGLADAKLSLGLVCLHGKDFRRAAVLLTEFLATNPASAALHSCLGEALSHCGDFAGAADQFEAAVRLDPDSAVLAGKRAQATLMAGLVAGRRMEVLAACRADPFVSRVSYNDIERRCFHLLSAFGHTDAAIWIGTQRLQDNPDDQELLYLLPVLCGQTFSRAPDLYVSALFDKFSSEFDRQLVDVLGYDAFRQLAQLVEEQGEKIRDVLDIGCGTGLSGPLLAQPGRHLTGVDLSSGMLEFARARQCYETLVHDDAVHFLAGRTQQFDLIFAADVLIYIGELQELFENVAQALKPGGLFAFSIESTSKAPLQLDVSGRFAHDLSHVCALGEQVGLNSLVSRSIDLRFETSVFVQGDLVVMRRAENTALH